MVKRVNFTSYKCPATSAPRPVREDLVCTGLVSTTSLLKTSAKVLLLRVTSSFSSEYLTSQNRDHLYNTSHPDGRGKWVWVKQRA